MPTQSGIWNLKQVRDGVAGALYAQQPLIDGITGGIGNVQSTLTISGVAFGLLQGTVRFTSGATIADVSVTPASDVSMTVNVPQAIYDLATGSTVGIKFITGLGVQSNTFNKPVTQFGADFLVIAGGGGSTAVSGGGAGGYRCSVTGELSGGGASAETELTLTTETNYTVTVGGGGPGQTIGSNSVFSTIESTGGGRAGIQNTANNVGGTGGSGGGSAYPSGGVGNVYSGGLGTANQGFDGGGHGSATGGSGGGGGGAGAVGTANTSVLPGNGGNGVESSITGSPVPRGGGGAGFNEVASPSAGTGGSGGGGAGGTAGAENTGGGGGASSPIAPVAGGSGVVIIKYPDAFTISNPGGGLTSTTATAGGFKVTTFTAGTGNVSFA